MKGIGTEMAYYIRTLTYDNLSQFIKGIKTLTWLRDSLAAHSKIPMLLVTLLFLKGCFNTISISIVTLLFTIGLILINYLTKPNKA